MAKLNIVSNKILFEAITLLSNERRFRIIELTQNKELNISQISKELKLSFNRCTDYVTMLSDAGLVLKRKEGKEVFVKSQVILADNKIFKLDNESLFKGSN